MNIFIEPSDVWLFRDGRPFAPNERGRAVSLFPPTPQTVQGVIRSARLAQSGESFDYRKWSDALIGEIGQPDTFGKLLRLRGPLVAKRQGNGGVQRYFPLPLDLTKLQNGWHILPPHPAPDLQTNWHHKDLQPLLPSPGEPMKFDLVWLDDSAFSAYLSGTAPTDDTVTKTGCLYGHESRFGVQIDSRLKRPADGMLYQVEFVRLEADIGLLVEVEGVTLSSSGLLQLGGEARAGHYETVTTGVTLSLDGRLTDGVKPLRFKVYFATPALFGHGWLPDAIDVRTLKGNWRGIDLKLIAAAIGKSQAIGGRDIAGGDSQRAIRRAVPAGSVYFFETQATADEVLAAFDGQCVCDAEADRQIGFGLGYVGRTPTRPPLWAL